MAVKFVFLLLILACLSANGAAMSDLDVQPGYEVVSKFEISGDQVQCLNSLAEMKSCSTEMVGLLLKKQANLGVGCCLSVSSITEKCSPATLTSFGFTKEVHSTLLDHCNKLAASSPAPAPLAGSD